MKKTKKEADFESKRMEPAEIEAWLKKQSPKKLVDLIMAQASTDHEFYNVLAFRVAADSPTKNISEMRSVLRRAMTINGFVSWRESHDYSNGVFRVLDRVRDMLGKHPSEVIELVEYALDLWEEAIQLIDDSDGCMGMIMDDLHKLHLDACRRAKPDPVALAERLLYRHIRSDWDIFPGAYEIYCPVLGKSGKARFREQVEVEWRKLLRFGPGDKNESRYGRDGKLQKMMLTIAEKSNDLNQIIDVMSRDISEPRDFLVIAERCRKSKAYALARQWAKQGLLAFSDHRDARLHDFLAEEYVRDHRTEEAVRVIWKTFESCLSLDRYKALAEYATKAKDWPAWRDKALGLAREAINGRKKTADNRCERWGMTADHSLLVEIFLWEKDIEAAWAEARTGGCSESIWLQLAKARENDHPEDAIIIYQRHVSHLLNQKNNHSYQDAVNYLAKIHEIMDRMNREAEFRQYLLALKNEWKRLRNFIKFVERKKWGMD